MQSARAGTGVVRQVALAWSVGLLFLTILASGATLAGDRIPELDAVFRAGFAAGGPDFSEIRLAGSAPVTRLPWTAVEPTFVHGHLIPRLERRFEGILPIYPSGQMRHELERSILFAEANVNARHQAMRGTQRALTDFLMDVWEIDRLEQAMERRLDRIVDRVLRRDGSKHEASGAGTAGRRRKADISFDVGISHLRPEGKMRYRSRLGELKLSLDVRGRAGISFKHLASSRVEIRCGLNPFDDRYSVSSLFHF